MIDTERHANFFLYPFISKLAFFIIPVYELLLSDLEDLSYICAHFLCSAGQYLADYEKFVCL